MEKSEKIMFSDCVYFWLDVSYWWKKIAGKVGDRLDKIRRKNCRLPTSEKASSTFKFTRRTFTWLAPNFASLTLILSKD